MLFHDIGLALAALAGLRLLDKAWPTTPLPAWWYWCELAVGLAVAGWAEAT